MRAADQSLAGAEMSVIDSRLFYCVFKDGAQRVVVAASEDIDGAVLAISLAECARMHEALLKARALILEAPGLSVVDQTGG